MKINRTKIEKNKYVIGDIHGCFFTLQTLISKLPENSEIILLGDLCDRGAHTKYVIEFVMKNNYKVILGNHDELMIKHAIESMKEKDNDWIKGTKMGAMETISSYENDIDMLKKHIEWLKTLPKYILIGNYFLTHGFGLPYYERRDDKEKSKLLNTNRTKGEDIYSDDWDIEDWRQHKIINIFGHESFDEVKKGENYYGIDTGCGYGKKLTALELGSMKTIEEKCDSRDIKF